MTKVKNKEKVLKSAKEKHQITYKGTLIRLLADFSADTLQARREWNHIFKGWKGKKPQTKNTLPSKVIIQNWRRDKELSRQTKTKGVRHH